ncbi:hypothetical protein GWI33_014519 [Rhynchophorus ferrugineus]|uniref:Uncharacterized protein n=1 Tax=Rhynchophorus ferrugineus TaxID=354439 RepID=A0A834I2G4_RHYFE|nr:hypothetical protein GWI33_014519 [Rhynchophorus ferrugineus]
MAPIYFNNMCVQYKSASVNNNVIILSEGPSQFKDGYQRIIPTENQNSRILKCSDNQIIPQRECEYHKNYRNTTASLPLRLIRNLKETLVSTPETELELSDIA